MHDLAESLIVEARVVQSGNAEVRLVQCVAPGPDPLFPLAIVMPITRDAGSLVALLASFAFRDAASTLNVFWCDDCESRRLGRARQEK